MPSQDIEAKFQQVELELTKLINPVPMPETATSDGKQSPSKVVQETCVGQDESHKGLSTSLATTTQEQRSYETLPQIVAQGLKKQKIAAYEALKQAGYIFNAVEYLIGEDVQ